MHAFVWREFILRNKGLTWGDLHRKWNLLLNSKKIENII
jgi:hypothetical protein